MTEDEAKTKWCPFVRYLATFKNETGKLETAGCFNRGGADSGLQTSRCIGSACMAWRWDKETWGTDDRGTKNSTEYGFCGLAGKP